MKKRMQGLIAGIIIGITLTGGMTFAKSGTERLEAVFNNIKLYVDGIKITSKDAAGKTVEPFIHNGTTYLPVRAVGEALGKQVKWDGKTQSVYIGEVPGDIKYLTDICPAYQYSNHYKEYSFSKSGGTKFFSMAGKEYSSGMTFVPLESDKNGQWAVYNLNSSYKKLEFTVGAVDGDLGFYQDRGESLYVYLDNELYKKIPLSSDMYPQKVSVDVTGVNQLKLLLHSSHGAIYGFWYGIGNPILK